MVSRVCKRMTVAVVAAACVLACPRVSGSTYVQNWSRVVSSLKLLQSNMEKRNKKQHVQVEVVGA